VGGEKYTYRQGISMLLQFFLDPAKNVSIRQGQHARHVLEDQGLRLELVDKTDVVPEENISRVIEKSLRRVDRKSLAGRAARYCR
jgi:hypothetical protein